MAVKSLGAYQTKLYQLTFGLILVFAGVFAVRKSMLGSNTPILNAVGVISVLAMVFLLDKRYWLFFWISAFLPNIPSLPFNGQELGIIFVSAVHLVRSALHLEPFAVWSKYFTFHAIVFVWIMMVFAINPAGFFILGSAAMGGRFYFAVILGFMALLTFSAIDFTETDAKWLLRSIVATSIWSVLKSVYGGSVSELQTGSDFFGSGGLGSRYYLIKAMSLYMILFACYPLRSILKSPRLFVLVFGLGIATILSGKRRAAGSLVLIPIFRSLLTDRDKGLTVICGFVAALGLAFTVAGDGAFYELPKSATRALSVVVPKYLTNRQVGLLNDYFRQQMRERARSVIVKSPWLGRKGFAMDTEAAVWSHSETVFSGQFQGHVDAGAWHSAWYAYAADFGVPCLLLFVALVVCEVRYSWRAVHTVVRGHYFPICIVYFTILLFLEIFFAYTTGHSAFTYREHCIWFGIIVALARGYKKSYGGHST